MNATPPFSIDLLEIDCIVRNTKNPRKGKRKRNGVVFRISADNALVAWNWMCGRMTWVPIADLEIVGHQFDWWSE